MALAGQGQARPAKAGQGRPRLAQAGEVQVPRGRPQPESKNYVFGPKIIKTYGFKPWGRYHRIPDVKTINIALIKSEKDLLGL